MCGGSDGGHFLPCRKNTRCCDCGHPAVPTLGRCAIHGQKLLREKDREPRRKIV